MTVTEFDLFPTKVLSLQFPDVEDLNRELYEHFGRDAGYQTTEYFTTADYTNLLDLAPTHPCLGRLHEMFLGGLAQWLRAAGPAGEYAVRTLMFANYARQYQFTIAHNHSAEVVGVYYVRTADAASAPSAPGPASPWDQDNGALILHDPRFNASLVGLGEDHYFKIQPQPGQMLIFPGYLWHSVTPNLEPYWRLAMSVNFSVEPRADEAAARAAPVRVLTVDG